jgi:hypothetical protein
MASPERKAAQPDAGQALVAPSISLPNGGGAIRSMGEKFAANPVGGTGSRSVPIVTSPGRSGFGPQLLIKQQAVLLDVYEEVNTSCETVQARCARRSKFPSACSRRAAR